MRTNACVNYVRTYSWHSFSRSTSPHPALRIWVHDGNLWPCFAVMREGWRAVIKIKTQPYISVKKFNITSLLTNIIYFFLWIFVHTNKQVFVFFFNNLTLQLLCVFWGGGELSCDPFPSLEPHLTTCANIIVSICKMHKHYHHLRTRHRPMNDPFTSWKVLVENEYTMTWKLNFCFWREQGGRNVSRHYRNVDFNSIWGRAWQEVAT